MNPPNLRTLLLEADHVATFIAKTELSEYDHIYHVHLAREVLSAEPRVVVFMHKPLRSEAVSSLLDQR